MVDSRITQAADWLSHALPAKGGCPCIFTLPNALSEHFAEGDFLGAAKRAIELSDSGLNVYFPVWLNKPGLSASSHGARADKTLSQVICIDVDIGTTGHAAKNNPTDEEFVEAWQKLGLPLVCGTHTGGGYHLYGRLTEPTADQEKWEPIIRGMLETLRVYFAARGRDVDTSLWQSNLVLRVPFTRNYKAGLVRDVTLVGDIANAPRLSLDDLYARYGHIVPKASAASPTTSNPKVLAELVESTRKTLHTYVKQLQTKGEPIKASRLKLVLDGKPYAAPGVRNLETAALVGQIGRKCPNLPLDVLIALIEPSHAAMMAETPDDQDFADLEKMLGKIRAKTDAEAEAERQRKDAFVKDVAENARLRDQVVDQSAADALATAGTSATGGGAAAGLAAEMMKGAAGPDSIPSADSQSVYTMDLIKARIAQQGKLAGVSYSSRTFSQCLGIRMPTGDTIWAFSFRTGDYTAMTTAAYKNFIAREVKRFPPAFFEANHVNEDLETRPKTADELMAETVTVADQKENEGGPIIGRTDIQCSYFYPLARQFVRAHCPLRDLPAEMSPDVDELFLTVLPDEAERERLLDHIVATRDLSKPSAGVRLHGEKNTCKSLVIEGIASQYGVKRSTKGDQYFTKYADWVNPVIHHEEKPSRNEHGDLIDGATHREAITQKRHVINPKGVRQYVVGGYVRHWYSENGENMFDFSGESEAELRASAERIDNFTFSPKTADWVAEKVAKEPDYFKRFLDEDLIAKHIAYLAKTRGIKNRGARMVVDGRLSESIVVLQSQDKNSNRILRAVLRAIEQNYRAVICGDGKAYANSEYLACDYMDITGDNQSRAPLAKDIRVVLKRFSLKKESDIKSIAGKRARYWELNVDELLKFADDHTDMDAEYLKEKINKPSLKVVPGESTTSSTPGVFAGISAKN